jgi:hypothetical protein
VALRKIGLSSLALAALTGLLLASSGEQSIEVSLRKEVDSYYFSLGLAELEQFLPESDLRSLYEGRFKGLPWSQALLEARILEEQGKPAEALPLFKALAHGRSRLSGLGSPWANGRPDDIETLAVPPFSPPAWGTVRYEAWEVTGLRSPPLGAWWWSESKDPVGLREAQDRLQAYTPQRLLDPQGLALRAKARRAFDQMDPGKAVQVWAQLAQRPAFRDEALRQIGLLTLDVHRHRPFERWLASASDRELLNGGRFWLDSSPVHWDLRFSREALNELLKRFAGSAYADDALFLLVKLELQDGKLEAAKAAFQRLARDYPQSDTVQRGGLINLAAAFGGDSPTALRIEDKFLRLAGSSRTFLTLTDGDLERLPRVLAGPLYLWRAQAAPASDPQRLDALDLAVEKAQAGDFSHREALYEALTLRRLQAQGLGVDYERHDSRYGLPVAHKHRQWHGATPGSASGSPEPGDPSPVDQAEEFLRDYPDDQRAQEVLRESIQVFAHGDTATAQRLTPFIEPVLAAQWMDLGFLRKRVNIEPHFTQALVREQYLVDTGQDLALAEEFPQSPLAFMAFLKACDQEPVPDPAKMRKILAAISLQGKPASWKAVAARA